MDIPKAAVVLSLALALALIVSPAVLSDDSEADIIIHTDIPENAGYEDWQFVVVAIFAIPLGVAIGLVIVFKVLFKDRE